VDCYCPDSPGYWEQYVLPTLRLVTGFLLSFSFMGFGYFRFLSLAANASATAYRHPSTAVSRCWDWWKELHLDYSAPGHVPDFPRGTVPAGSCRWTERYVLRVRLRVTQWYLSQVSFCFVLVFCFFTTVLQPGEQLRERWVSTGLEAIRDGARKRLRVQRGEKHSNPWGTTSSPASNPQTRAVAQNFQPRVYPSIKAYGGSCRS
jgi:hypothetical protein